MIVNEIGSGRLSNFFARLLNVDGLRPVSELAPELMPTMTPWERPEFWVLLGGSLANCMFSAAAPGAGSVNVVVILNPTGSRVLVIIEQLNLGDAIAYRWGNDQQTSTAGLGAVQVEHRDNRKANPAAAGSFSTGALQATVAAGNLAAFAGVNGGIMTGPNVVPVSIILKPGSRFILVNNTTNQAMNVGIDFRERVAEDTELAVF